VRGWPDAITRQRVRPARIGIASTSRTATNSSRIAIGRRESLTISRIWTSRVRSAPRWRTPRAKARCVWGAAGCSAFPTCALQAVLEVGCGVGNCVYPLLDRSPATRFHACDFSAEAVGLVKVRLHSEEPCMPPNASHSCIPPFR
jgi:methylase of polypeptide subunit release factors